MFSNCTSVGTEQNVRLHYLTLALVSLGETNMNYISSHVTTKPKEVLHLPVRAVTLHAAPN